MIQEIITYIVVALAVVYVMYRLIRRIYGKGNSCSCECGDNCSTCDSCPLKNNCKKIK